MESETKIITQAEDCEMKTKNLELFWSLWKLKIFSIFDELSTVMKNKEILTVCRNEELDKF